MGPGFYPVPIYIYIIDFAGFKCPHLIDFQVDSVKVTISSLILRCFQC